MGLSFYLEMDFYMRYTTTMQLHIHRNCIINCIILKLFVFLPQYYIIYVLIMYIYVLIMYIYVLIMYIYCIYVLY